MSLQDKIRACEKCPLFEFMGTSPVPPEWNGVTKIMFITDTLITMEHDYAQTPLFGATRLRFIQLVEKYFDSWYITPLVKCSPKGATHSVKNTKICTDWIDHEIDVVKPKVIIGCGLKMDKYVGCDHYTMSAARITQSSKHEKIFEELLEKIKGQINGS